MPRPRRTRTVARTASVGRLGRLTLEYVRQEKQTVFGRTSSQTPWHLFPPIYLDDSGAAFSLLLNPSGGLVGGDHLSIETTLASQARVIISTPSANRVYRSLGEVSVQEIDISVGPGAVLEWLPEHTIPFAGSRFRQSIHVQLAAGATVLLWDALASGRIARGERWKFTSLENEIRITTASGALVREHYALAPADKLGGLGLAEDWDYVASLYVVSEAVTAETWSRLEAKLVPILDERPGHVLGGCSQPAVPGLAVKLVARSAPDLTGALDGLWAAIRMALWGLPPVVLRKY